MTHIIKNLSLKHLRQLQVSDETIDFIQRNNLEGLTVEQLYTIDKNTRVFVGKDIFVNDNCDIGSVIVEDIEQLQIDMLFIYDNNKLHKVFEYEYMFDTYVDRFECEPQNINIKITTFDSKGRKTKKQTILDVDFGYVSDFSPDYMQEYLDDNKDTNEVVYSYDDINNIKIRYCTSTPEITVYKNSVLIFNLYEYALLYYKVVDSNVVMWEIKNFSEAHIKAICDHVYNNGIKNIEYEVGRIIERLSESVLPNCMDEKYLALFAYGKVNTHFINLLRAYELINDDNEYRCEVPNYDGSESKLFIRVDEFDNILLASEHRSSVNGSSVIYEKNEYDDNRNIVSTEYATKTKNKYTKNINTQLKYNTIEYYDDGQLKRIGGDKFNVDFDLINT